MPVRKRIICGKTEVACGKREGESGHRHTRKCRVGGHKHTRSCYSRDYFIDVCYKGVRIREAVGPNKKLAEAVLSKRKAEIAEGKLLDKKEIPNTKFREFAREYLSWSRANKKSFTRDITSIRALGSFFKGKLLCEITPQSIERYKLERQKTVANATINRELACLKHMYSLAVKWGKAVGNPVKAVRLFKENNGRMRVLSKDEEEKLLAASSDHLKPILITALNTGMRRGEILNLTWDRVDFREKIITLINTKSGENRVVPMNACLTKTLKNVKRTGRYVFCNERGEPFKDVKKAFRGAIKRAAIPHLVFHDLRHTFATRYMHWGDVVSLKDILGHKTIQMTMRYAHPTLEKKRWGVEMLDTDISRDFPGTYMAQEKSEMPKLLCARSSVG